MFADVTKILVVDDERINIQILYEGLSGDYDILSAANGADGLAIAREQQPDLILLDIMLADSNGHDICRALKKDKLTANIPIIFVTAQDTPEDELAGLKLGAVDYFTKPFSMPLVRMRVAKQIELKQKTDILEHLSRVDGLTGVANRRQFDEKLAQAINYVDRNHRGLSLLFIDIDFFKQYNDTYGHVKGDQALKLIANLLKQSASRPLDIIARYGGEEFAVILIDSAPAQGKGVAEKFKRIVESQKIEHKDSEKGYLTVSIGVSHINAKHQSKIQSKDLIHHADQCLYLAKNKGRNKVVAKELMVD